MEVQKSVFCAINYYLLLTGWPLMGDPYSVTRKLMKAEEKK
jgi:hypothetical protein